MNRKETFIYFKNIAESHGVCDHTSFSNTHERIYMGKTDRRKSRFLGCSRVGWICLYFSGTDKKWIDDICTNAAISAKDETGFDYRIRVEINEFEHLLSTIAEVLGRTENH